MIEWFKSWLNSIKFYDCESKTHIQAFTQICMLKCCPNKVWTWQSFYGFTCSLWTSAICTYCCCHYNLLGRCVWFSACHVKMACEIITWEEERGKRNGKWWFALNSGVMRQISLISMGFLNYFFIVSFNNFWFSFILIKRDNYLVIALVHANWYYKYLCTWIKQLYIWHIWRSLQWQWIKLSLFCYITLCV